MHRHPTATPAETQQLAARMQDCVENDDGTIRAHFSPLQKLNRRDADAHTVLLEERTQLSRALHHSIGDYRYIHVLGQPENGQLVAEFSKEAVAAFQQFRHTYVDTAPARQSWIRRAMGSVMDGIAMHACAQEGCIPQEWQERIRQPGANGQHSK